VGVVTVVWATLTFYLGLHAQVVDPIPLRLVPERHVVVESTS
jgi:hypothetical protein